MSIADELTRVLHSREDAEFAAKTIRAYLQRREVVERAAVAMVARRFGVSIKSAQTALAFRQALYDATMATARDALAAALRES